MFPRLGDVIDAIEDLKARGVIVDYAIAGAFALSVWDEASVTFDLDIVVLLPPSDAILTSLGPIYEWAAERGYPSQAEHIQISGVPVQFLPAPDDLTAEAVIQAGTVEMAGRKARVVTPEYLCAMWSSGPASTGKRKARVAQMIEAGLVDEAVFADLRSRYNLAGNDDDASGIKSTHPTAARRQGGS